MVFSSYARAQRSPQEPGTVINTSITLTSRAQVRQPDKSGMNGWVNRSEINAYTKNGGGSVLSDPLPPCKGVGPFSPYAKNGCESILLSTPPL